MGKLKFIYQIISHSKIAYLLFSVFIVLGIVGLFKMNKEEYPSVDIKSGLVVGAYPGATAREVKEQLTEPIEEILFSFPEVKRKEVQSFSRDGLCYIYVDLDVSSDKKSETWIKIRQKFAEVKPTLPLGVFGIWVIDEFSQVATTLIALESSEKSYKEMEDYAEKLADKIRSLEYAGGVNIIGGQSEEIAVTIDHDRLSMYGVSPTLLALDYQTSALTLLSGSHENEFRVSPIHYASSLSSEQEIAQKIIYTDPMGGVVRLSDVATVERRYKEPSSLVKYNGHNTLILSVEMRAGYNIVQFGREVDAVLDEFKSTLPPAVTMNKITDQSRVVGDSVKFFLVDLFIAMVVVVITLLTLFPLCSALIAASGLPVCVMCTIAVLWAVGIELNTVTLAALIVVLGMIVDDSIITMDGYMEKLGQGFPLVDAAERSAGELFMPMLMATAGLGLCFHPTPNLVTGEIGSFTRAFPWVVFTALFISLAYAMLVVPSLETRFIRSANLESTRRTARFQKKFFDILQQGYERLEEKCFKYPRLTIGIGVMAVLLAVVVLFTKINVQMLPMASRSYFAIEVYLTPGSNVRQTESVADSIQNTFLRDPRVKSVTSFVGRGTPRFTFIYAPITPGTHVAQIIVNTHSDGETEELLAEYGPMLEHAFPDAQVRFKQMSYHADLAPIVVEFYGADQERLKIYADSLRHYMMRELDNELQWIHSDCDGMVSSIQIKLDPDEAARMGVNRTLLSLSLAGVLSPRQMSTVWEGKHSIPVNLYGKFSDANEVMGGEDIETMDPDYDRIGDYMVPSVIPGVSVPLRQVARLNPVWERECISRKGGKDVVSVMADMQFGYSQPYTMNKIRTYVEEVLEPAMPEGMQVRYAGLSGTNERMVPEIVLSIICGLFVLFFFMLLQFRKVSLSFLTLALSVLSIFGTFISLAIFRLDFGVTAVLGMISLMGIIMRNGIIMFEYADHLRCNEHLSAREAAFKAGQRRMRPIFLTSCTTALGVLPMVLRVDALWKPMGVVICIGTVLSLLLVVTIMPVSYWFVFKNKDRK